MFTEQELQLAKLWLEAAYNRDRAWSEGQCDCGDFNAKQWVDVELQEAYLDGLLEPEQKQVLYDFIAKIDKEY